VFSDAVQLGAPSLFQKYGRAGAPREPVTAEVSSGIILMPSDIGERSSRDDNRNIRGTYEVSGREAICGSRRPIKRASASKMHSGTRLRRLLVPVT
jgi:hypothetical protein